MTLLRRWAILVCGILLLGGEAFAAAPVIEVKPGTGMAFGAFDITESYAAVTHVVLMRVRPTKGYMGSAGERGTVTYQNGEFFSPNLTPGTYALMGVFSGSTFFPLGGSFVTRTCQVEPGGVAYIGSYKLKTVKGGLFQSVKGSFERVDSVEAETQLLGWLAKELAASDWAAIVSARLDQVKK